MVCIVTVHFCLIIICTKTEQNQQQHTKTQCPRTKTRQSTKEEETVIRQFIIAYTRTHLRLEIRMLFFQKWEIYFWKIKLRPSCLTFCKIWNEPEHALFVVFLHPKFRWVVFVHICQTRYRYLCLPTVRKLRVAALRFPFKTIRHFDTV